MRLSFPLYVHQFMLININIVPTQLFVIKIYVKHIVVPMFVPQVNLLVLKLCKPASIVSCNKPVIFSPVYKSRHAGNICTSKTVCCSLSCKLASTLIHSDPVKSFVTCKTVCFSNVSMAKEFNSVNYCLVTCTEHPVNVISSVVRKSVLSYRTACPVDRYKCQPFVYLPLCFLQNSPLHFSHGHFCFETFTAFSKATCNTLSLLTIIISIINSQKYHPHPHHPCYYHHHHLHHHHNM